MHRCNRMNLPEKLRYDRLHAYHSAVPRSHSRSGSTSTMSLPALSMAGGEGREEESLLLVKEMDFSFVEVYV